MNSHDWEQIGNDIFRTVQDAVESCNYDRLSQNISDAVNQVVDSVTRGVKQTSEHVHQAQQRKYGNYSYQEVNNDNYHYGGQAYQGTSNYSYGKQTPATFQTNTPSRAGSVILTVFGGVLGGTSLVGLIACMVFGFLFGARGFLVGAVFSAIVLLGSAGMLGKGIGKLIQIGRLKKYLRTIGNKEYCNIEELTSAVGKAGKFVVKDLEKMIRKGWLPQGHLDKQKSCLMLTDRMYEQYQQLEAQKEQMQKAEAQAAEERRQKAEAQRKNLSPEVQKIIEQGDEFVKKIRECNDAIPGEEISAKIYRMELIVDRIFDRIEEHPESVNDIRKLMDYYLPTTVKLLEAYAQMDAQPIGGENIQSAKREIEATIDTLNVAFEKILDSLFQETAWDVSSDISVLNTILAQEGLKEDGLKK